MPPSLSESETLAPPLAKPATPPSPSPEMLVAVRRVEIGELDLALPARLDGPDLDGGDGLELVVGNHVELLAAGDAALQHLGIIELLPHHLALGGKLDRPFMVIAIGILLEPRANGALSAKRSA